MIVSRAFPLENVDAICGFYFLFLGISKPNGNFQCAFLRPDPAWNSWKLLKLMFTALVIPVASVFKSTCYLNRLFCQIFFLCPKFVNRKIKCAAFSMNTHGKRILKINFHPPIFPNFSQDDSNQLWFLKLFLEKSYDDLYSRNFFRPLGRAVNLILRLLWFSVWSNGFILSEMDFTEKVLFHVFLALWS